MFKKKKEWSLSYQVDVKRKYEDRPQVRMVRPGPERAWKYSVNVC